MYECDSQMGENYVYMLHARVAYTRPTHGGGSYYFLAEDQKRKEKKKKNSSAIKIPRIYKVRKKTLHVQVIYIQGHFLWSAEKKEKSVVIEQEFYR